MDQPRVNFAQSCVSRNTLNVALYIYVRLVCLQFVFGF